MQASNFLLPDRSGRNDACLSIDHRIGDRGRIVLVIFLTFDKSELKLE